MTETETPPKWGSGVLISPPALARMDFDFGGVGMAEDTPTSTEYELSIHRFAHLTAGVEFSASIVDVPELRLSATYRMVFTLAPESPEAQQPETAFQQIAARLAPLAMYPFLRETLASAAMKAGLPPIILPIQNVGALFKADDIEVSPPPEEDAGRAQDASGETS